MHGHSVFRPWAFTYGGAMKTEGSYADVAAAMNRALGTDIDRRQVHAWFRRGTRNAAGIRFPRPVREEHHPKRTTARYIFFIPAAIEWYAAGMPGKNPNQYSWAREE
jgi:hypothetical protein